MKINISINNNIMTISQVKKLAVENAREFERVVIEQADDSVSIIFDANYLEYISSTGLRALLNIRKKHDLSVINVSQDVYDIFETTGFCEIIPTKKKRKQINIEGCEVIGTGGTGTIYRIDEETVAKVFNHSFDLPAVEREHDITKNALVSGIPTMIPFDIAECNGQYAIVYELLTGSDYVNIIRKNPGKMSEYIRDYAGFIREMNRVSVSPKIFKSHKETYINLLESCEAKLSEEEYKLFRKLFEAIPEGYGFVHGDCHMKNIMLSDNERLIIDLEGCGYGHYFFELIAICCDYKLPGLSMFKGMKDFVVEMVMGFNKARCLEIWNLFFEEYMGDNDNKRDIDEMCTVYAYLRHTLNAFLNPLLAPDFIIEEMKKYILEAANINFDKYRKLLKQM